MEKLHISDLFKTLFVLAAAYKISDILLGYTGVENNSALIYALAVLIISRVTDGYLWGIQRFLHQLLLHVPLREVQHDHARLYRGGHQHADRFHRHLHDDFPDQAAGPGCHPPGTAHPGAVPDEPAAER